MHETVWKWNQNSICILLEKLLLKFISICKKISEFFSWKLKAELYLYLAKLSIFLLIWKHWLGRSLALRNIGELQLKVYMIIYSIFCWKAWTSAYCKFVTKKCIQAEIFKPCSFRIIPFAIVCFLFSSVSSPLMSLSKI